MMGIKIIENDKFCHDFASNVFLFTKTTDDRGGVEKRPPNEAPGRAGWDGS